MMLWAIFIVVLFVVGLIVFYLDRYARTIDKARRRRKGAKQGAAEYIPIEPEHFIPLLKANLEKALEATVGDADRALYDQFADLLELVVKMEYRGLTKRLLQDFEVFDPKYPAVTADQLSEDEVARRESRFLAAFHVLMEKCNFQPVTEAEADFADSGSFQLRVPTEIQWQNFDDLWLERFYASDVGRAFRPKSPPNFGDRILLWHRGVSKERMTGRFIAEKVDTLLSSLFERFACVVYDSAFWHALPVQQVAVVDTGAEDDLSANGTDGQPRAERLALCAQGWPGVRGLLGETTVQEPTFKEVVAMFRMAPGAAPDQGIAGDDSSIYVKTFRDIPLADLELALPCKRILFTTTDFLRLLIIAGSGLALALREIGNSMGDGEGFHLSTMGWTAIVVMLGYLSKIYYDIQFSMLLYQRTVMNELYSKSTDNHSGVLLYLLEALEAQEFKESVVAYTLLAEHDGEVSERELDEQAEAFIAREMRRSFGDDAPAVDFEVDDAVDKLLRFGLAELVREAGADGTGRLIRRVPLPDAVKALQKRLTRYNETHHDHRHHGKHHEQLIKAVSGRMSTDAAGADESKHHHRKKKRKGKAE